jgi:ppGpp synthetase/RelA/SpoT-type nucleotidyltranferase
VKDEYGLIQKILRKINPASSEYEKESKYVSISVDNYKDILSDILGIRILHLFKSDHAKIDDAIRDTFDIIGKPEVKYATGDSASDEENREDKYSYRQQKEGYRSVHYDISYRDDRDLILFELQVRSVFEHGFAEIDHQIRYPNLSNVTMLSNVAALFSKVTGLSDEVATYFEYFKKEYEDLNSTIQDLTEKNTELANKISNIDKAGIIEHAVVDSQSNPHSNSVIWGPQGAPTGSAQIHATVAYTLGQNANNDNNYQQVSMAHSFDVSKLIDSRNYAEKIKDIDSDKKSDHENSTDR